MKFFLVFLLFLAITQHFLAISARFLAKTLTLKNKLQVVLVSSKESDFSGMCLQIPVGSAFEPREKLHGLAHLLEHMLHFSSKTYPKEELFRELLGVFQGNSNAMTSDRETSYFFTLQHADLQAFSQVGSVFAHFFIDPLFEKDQVNREIHAVHNEFTNDLTSNDWRFLELLRDLSSESSLSRHFSVGNSETLANSQETHVFLQDFFKKFYSSHLMKLVIFAPFAEKELEKLALLFEQVNFVANFAEPAHFRNRKPAFSQKNRGKLVKVQKIGAAEGVFAVVFPFEGAYFPRKNRVLAEKALEFLKKLVEFKGKRGILARLRGFVQEIDAFFVEKHVDLRLFVVKFKGLRRKVRKTRVLCEFFAFFREIAADSARLRTIYQEIAWQQYVFLQNRAPNAENSDEFVQEMLRFIRVLKGFRRVSTKTFLKEALLPAFRRKLLLKYLQYVSNPRNSLIIRGVPQEKLETERRKAAKVLRFRRKPQQFSVFSDDVMRFLYKTREIPLNWPQCPQKTATFLAKSEYFPKNLSLKTRCPAKIVRVSLENLPFLSEKRDFLRVFLRKRAFPRLFYQKTANASCLRRELQRDLAAKPQNLENRNIFLRIFTDRAHGPRISATFYAAWRRKIKISRGFLQVFCDIMQQKLRESLQEIEEMWGSVRVSAGKRGVFLRFDGFSSRFCRVFAKVFAVFREILSENLEKTEFPLEKAKETASFLESKAKILRFYAKSLFSTEKPRNFLQFVRNLRTFRRNFKIKGLIVGNFLRNEAESQIFRYFRRNFPELSKKPRKSLRFSCFYEDSAAKAAKTLVFREKSANPQDINAAVLNIYLKKGLKVAERRVLKRFLGVLRAKAFSFLRTKRQLGYIVAVSPYFSENYAGFGVLVQGYRHSSQELDQEIEAFLKEFRGILAEISEKTLLSAEKRAVSARIRRKSSTLREKCENLWRSAAENAKIEQVSLENASKTAFLQVFAELTAENRTKISLQIASSLEKTGAFSAAGARDLEKIAQFLRK